MTTKRTADYADHYGDGLYEQFADAQASSGCISDVMEIDFGRQDFSRDVI
ncbi:MAG: hypothetical protein M3Y84_05425 [Acidobacteriota bacterium]|nr:hypothetical protein [Acidobacteriota bacterium]